MGIYGRGSNCQTHVSVLFQIRVMTVTHLNINAMLKLFYARNSFDISTRCVDIQTFNWFHPNIKYEQIRYK